MPIQELKTIIWDDWYPVRGYASYVGTDAVPEFSSAALVISTAAPVVICAEPLVRYAVSEIRYAVSVVTARVSVTTDGGLDLSPCFLKKTARYKKR